MDISYGGENGFNQAIELASDALQNVKFIQEKKLIGAFFDEISRDTGKYVFGHSDTLMGLEMGAVEILICWENLDVTRYDVFLSSLSNTRGFAAYLLIVIKRLKMNRKKLPQRISKLYVFHAK